MTEEESPDGFGLDKDARLQDKRQRAANEARDVDPLDPPFPYYVIPFTPPRER